MSGIGHTQDMINRLQSNKNLRQRSVLPVKERSEKPGLRTLTESERAALQRSMQKELRSNNWLNGTALVLAILVVGVLLFKIYQFLF